MEKDLILKYYKNNIVNYTDIINKGRQKENISLLRSSNKNLDKRDPFSDTAPLRLLMLVYVQKRLNLLFIDYLKTADLKTLEKSIDYLNDNVNELIDQKLL